MGEVEKLVNVYKTQINLSKMANLSTTTANRVQASRTPIKINHITGHETDLSQSWWSAFYQSVICDPEE